MSSAKRERHTHVRVQDGARERRTIRTGRNDGRTARWCLVLSLARSKFIRSIRSGHVERASLRVESVLAVVGGGHRWITGFDAELVASDEAEKKVGDFSIQA